MSLGTSFQQMQAVLEAQVQAPGAPREGVRLLSISLDPRDSLHDLAAYSERMKAHEQHWRLARVRDPADLQRLLAAFQVVVVPMAAATSNTTPPSC